ncbi:MAG: hypothetical protein D8M61_21130 [Ignavibacteriae bacterium]|nr:hypothetical protein [Ignavibacteriota bacterium]
MSLSLGAAARHPFNEEIPENQGGMGVPAPWIRRYDGVASSGGGAFEPGCRRHSARSLQTSDREPVAPRMDRMNSGISLDFHRRRSNLASFRLQSKTVGQEAPA